MWTSRTALWVCAVMLVFSTGCARCGEKIVPVDRCKGVNGNQADHPNPCESSTECADHFACSAVKDVEGLMCCTLKDRACVTEADCCPGQTCPVDRKKCFDKFLECTTDTDCGDKGDRFCEPWTDIYGTSNRCRFHACGSLGECPDGQSCFQGECMADLPCSGTCPSGSACVPTIDRCQDYVNPTDRAAAACPMTCNAGYIATFNDNRNIWDSCNLPAVQCECAELPGLHSGDLGRFSALGADPGKALFVSMYDGEFGDLVVAKYGLDGTRQAMEYVDGVPSGTPTYGPSGARGGVADPGDDVGRYTDLAVNNGFVFVSYYDVKNGDLKLAIRSTDGTWTKQTVDGANANLGQYTSVAIDSQGNPGISYFQLGGDATFNTSDCPAPAPTGPKAFITALKFAKATTAVPTSASDWSIKTLACMSRPTPACYQCANVCADPGSGPGCYTPGTGCTGCDPQTEVCVMVGSTPTCGKSWNPSNLQDVPVGVGAFSSLVFNGNDAIIAYMKRNPATATTAPEGDLYGVRVPASGNPAAPVLLDASGDTGFFPDLKLEPSSNSVAIGYHDFTSKQFKFYFAPALQTGVTPEVIDTGVSMPGEQGFVGTDSALVFGPSAGQVWAVYQDATRGDLKIAKRGAAWTVQTPLRTEGAVGFFADGVFTDGKVYASHARIHARLVQGEAKVDNSLILEQTTGN